jgi:hypothetical protein
MSREYKINHKKAWCYFIALGLLPVDAKKNEWCLHHKDPALKYKDPRRYNEWRVEDLVPMLKSEHTSMHQAGRHHSEETRQKLRTANLGKVLSEETRRKISEAGKGRPCSEETRMKRSASLKGHEVSEETRLKISAAQKGRKKGAQPRELVARRAEAIRNAMADPEKRKEISKRVSALVWITDGTRCARIPKDAPIPDGWRKGRKKQ